MEKIIDRIKQYLESIKNKENSEEINSMLEKLEQTPIEKAMPLLKSELFIDEEGNVNQYMIQRMISTGKENKSNWCLRWHECND